MESAKEHVSNFWAQIFSVNLPPSDPDGIVPQLTCHLSPMILKQVNSLNTHGLIARMIQQSFQNRVVILQGSHVDAIGALHVLCESQRYFLNALDSSVLHLEHQKT